MSRAEKIVAKLVIKDQNDQYLLLLRSNHPRFGKDPDIPGGTLEEGEAPLATMLREVYEEAGVMVEESAVQEIYNGTDYSKHGTRYVLYAVSLRTRPEVTISWEHSSYEWLPLKEFLEKAKNAEDTYMRMVGDMIAAQTDR